MKKIIQISSICLGLALVFTINANAQKGPRHTIQGGLWQYQAHLELTEAQQLQIKKIQDQYREQLKSLHEPGDRPAAENRSKIRELRSSIQGEILAVLTDEQQQKLKTLQEERRSELKQHREAQRERWAKVDKRALHQELQQYREEHIRPVMLNQRAKLEKEISEEDRSVLAELRQQITVYKKNHSKRSKESLRSRRDRNGKDLHQSRSDREGMKEHFEQLRGLVQKYDEHITELLSEIEPNQEKWHREMGDIRQKYLGAQDTDGSSGLREKQTRKSRKHDHFLHDAGAKSKGRFLLLDPLQSPTQKADIDILDIKVFPSPASGSNVLEYRIPAAGTIRIEIIDENGKLARQVLNAERAAGIHQEQVDLSKLSNRIYYYRITDSKGAVVTKRFAVVQE